MVTCSTCWLHTFVKNGFSRWKQKYKCSICHTNFVWWTKKRLSTYDTVTIIERYLSRESINKISLSYEWYTVPWIRKHITILKTQIVNFDILFQNRLNTSYFFSIIHIKEYRSLLSQQSLPHDHIYWIYTINSDYILYISNKEINNSISTVSKEKLLHTRILTQEEFTNKKSYILS